MVEIAAPIPNATAAGPFGSNLVSRDYVEFGVPVIRGKNLVGRWIGGEFAFVSKEKAATLRTNTARPGDIIFTQRGTLGQVSLVPADEFSVYVISQSQMKLTVDPEKADAGYVYYACTSDDFVRQVNDNAVAAGVPHINLGTLRGLFIPLPPLETQEAIAFALAMFDDRIALLRETSSTLEAIAKALFKSWFVDFDPVRAKAEGLEPEGMDAGTVALFPSELEKSELGFIPKGWRVDEIGKVVACVGGGTPSTKKPGYWDEPIHHWVTPKDLSRLQAPVLIDTDRKVSDEGLAKISSGLLPVGTLLLSSRAPIGYLAITQIPTAINQGFIAMPPGGELSPTFLLFWTHLIMGEIKQKANGSTFMEISKSAFRPIKLCVPSPSIVEAFNSIASPMVARIAANEQQRVQLAAFRDALLPRLISGKLRLPEAKILGEEAIA